MPALPQHSETLHHLAKFEPWDLREQVARCRRDALCVRQMARILVGDDRGQHAETWTEADLIEIFGDVANAG